jgi:Sulfotransferase domain
MDALPTTDGSLLRTTRGKGRCVVLWAVPRSVSTAFERTFVGRDGFDVLHEPYTPSYYFSRSRRSARYGDQPELADYDANGRLIELFDAAAAHVFVKDLAFQAAPYVSDEVLRRATNTFMIRHPQRVLASLLPLKPDASEEELGFLPLYELWTRVHRLAGEVAPILVEGDRFRRHPHAVLEKFCSRTGLPFDPACLSWSQGRIRDWEPSEAQCQQKWHATLERSKGVIPPQDDTALEIPSRFRGPYRNALAVYQEMLRHAL